MQKKKRVRYKIPTYRKVYTCYQYHRRKYTTIYKKIHKLAVKYGEKIYYNVNPYRVLELCYVRDDDGHAVSLSDERHIFRYKVFHNILKEIADYLIIAYELQPSNDVLRYLFKRTHIAVFVDAENEQIAEIYETIDKPLYLRIRAHVELLRNLYKGLEIEEAIQNTRNKYNLPVETNKQN